MGKSHETFGKKERESKRLQKIKNKQQKKEQRQADSKKGKSLEEMLAYIDENGNISEVPPDKMRVRRTNLDDISIGTPRRNDEQGETRHGIVTFFNQAKGYGFIKELQSQKSIFVHANRLLDPIKENDKVTFEVEKGLKGLQATRVKLN
jgi:cold shock CspA family protein